MIRKRYYWTNIPIGEIPTKNVSIKDLLDSENPTETIHKLKNI